MIEYTSPCSDYPQIKVPKLHRVTFKHHNALHMRAWLEENCRAPWYVSPGWTSNFVEFEDDLDALAFALRWS